MKYIETRKARTICPGCGGFEVVLHGAFWRHGDRDIGGLCPWSCKLVPRPMTAEVEHELFGTSAPATPSKTRGQLDRERRANAHQEWREARQAEEAAIVKPPKPPARPLCQGKLIYFTEAAGEAAATRTTRANLRMSRPEGRTAARCYKCPRCNRWHVTSQAPRAALARASSI